LVVLARPADPGPLTESTPRAMMVSCPGCGSSDIHRRWPTRVGERLVMLLCWRPCVCWTCMRRFWVFAPFVRRRSA